MDIKSDLDSIAKAVSYFGNVKGLDITVTTPFDTFGGFINRVYDKSFPIMEYNGISMKYVFPKDIKDALYAEE